MVRQSVKVNISSGLHFRPTGKLTEKAMVFESDITMKKGENETNVKSFLSVLAACIKCGDEVEIICEGTDEKEALEAVVDFLSHE